MKEKQFCRQRIRRGRKKGEIIALVYTFHVCWTWILYHACCFCCVLLVLLKAGYNWVHTSNKVVGRVEWRMMQQQREVSEKFRSNEEPEITWFAPTAQLTYCRGDQLKLFICKYVPTANYKSATARNVNAWLLKNVRNSWFSSFFCGCKHDDGASVNKTASLRSQRIDLVSLIYPVYNFKGAKKEYKSVVKFFYSC